MKKAGILIAIFLLAAAMLTGCMRGGDTTTTNTTSATVTPTGSAPTTAPRPSNNEGSSAPTDGTDGSGRMQRRLPSPMR